nr:hypothetical protein [Micromonospora sp. DSM 115978]
MDPEVAVGFEQAQKALGLVTALIAVAAYLVVVAVRAATDEQPLTAVAWHGPMLVAIVGGGLIYGISYGVARWRLRGRLIVDERDAEITRRAELAGSGLTGLAVLAALIMLAVEVHPFWVAHVLLLGSFLGTVIGIGTALAAYRYGVQQ